MTDIADVVGQILICGGVWLGSSVGFAALFGIYSHRYKKKINGFANEIVRDAEQILNGSVVNQQHAIKTINHLSDVLDSHITEDCAAYCHYLRTQLFRHVSQEYLDSQIN